MIKTKKGKVNIKGSVAEAMADLTCVIRGFNAHIADITNDKADAKDLVDRCVKTAFMTDEEIEAEILKQEKEKLCKILSEVTESIKKDLEGEEAHE